MTCDGLDVIAKNVSVPQEMRVGDWLCFSGFGAYTYGSRSNFNGMKSVENVYRISSSKNELGSVGDAGEMKEFAEQHSGD